MATRIASHSVSESVSRLRRAGLCAGLTSLRLQPAPGTRARSRSVLVHVHVQPRGRGPTRAGAREVLHVHEAGFGHPRSRACGLRPPLSAGGLVGASGFRVLLEAVVDPSSAHAGRRHELGYGHAAFRRAPQSRPQCRVGIGGRPFRFGRRWVFAVSAGHAAPSARPPGARIAAPSWRALWRSRRGHVVVGYVVSAGAFGDGVLG